MRLNILGCYSATPRTMTNPTSQVLEIRNHVFLIDCGEGTQVQLRKSQIRFSRIKHIFISHLHGDHFFGLPGLISTFRLLGREADLHIYGPKGIKEAITLFLKLGDSWTNYKLIFHELEDKVPELLFEDDTALKPVEVLVRATDELSLEEMDLEKGFDFSSCKLTTLNAESCCFNPTLFLTLPPTERNILICDDY